MNIHGRTVYTWMFRKTIKYGILIINWLFFILIFLLMIICLQIIYLISRNRRKKQIAIFAGLEHVIDKSASRGNWLEKKGYKSFFYSFEKTGSSGSSFYKPKIIKVPSQFTIDLFYFLFLLLKKNPLYLEIYFEGLSWRQVFYAATARLNKTVVIANLRGELYYYKTTLSPLKKLAIKTTLKISNNVFYRETYMYEILKKMGIKQEKLYFDPNKIVVRNNVKFSRPEQIVLFLNGIKKWRRIDLLIEAIPKVTKEFPNSKFLIVGARNKAEREEVNFLAERFNVRNYVELHGWTKEPYAFFEKASIFVLPADLVYCNLSLLEAMERGVPSIVANVKDADKIIQHNKNGFLCKQDANDISLYIVTLFKNEDKRIRMGKAARQTIIEKYNDEDRMQPILKSIEQKQKEIQ